MKKILDDIKIVNFNRKHLESVIDLAANTIPHDLENLEDIRTSFEIISDWVENKLEDALKNYAENELKLSFRYGLHYIVALDPTKKIVGVSGIYSINNGYISKLGIHCNNDQLERLEDATNLWIGWTAVDKDLQKRGLGRKLIKNLLIKITSFSTEYKFPPTHLMVIADKSAGYFYAKLGMLPIIIEERVVIYSMLLENV